VTTARYNLEDDPYEQENLVGRHPDKAVEMDIILKVGDRSRARARRPESISRASAATRSGADGHASSLYQTAAE